MPKEFSFYRRKEPFPCHVQSIKNVCVNLKETDGIIELSLFLIIKSITITLAASNGSPFQFVSDSEGKNLLPKSLLPNKR